MSKYTTQVRFICESKAGLPESLEEPNVDDVLDKSWFKIFDDFPIYDEIYRPLLCKKILKHYYTNEICAESVGLWLLWLNTTMQEIMPLYNQFYNSCLLEFNPLYDVNKTTTRKGSNKTDSTQNNNTINSGDNTANTSTISKHSDTPQGGVEGLEQGNYMTNATINSGNNATTYNDNTNSTISGVVNSFDDYVETVFGKQGSENYSDMLTKFRSTFINVDMLIIDELSSLFMTLW